jgi:hypothetical protein
MVIIYGLSSSENPSDIRYIGKTTNLEKRLKKHLSNSSLIEDSHKNNWILKELDKGNFITSTIIEEVEESNWEDKEIYWIAEYKKMGFKLTNSTIGGEGLKLNEDIIAKSELIKKNNYIKSKEKEIELFKITQSLNRWFGKRICPVCKNTVNHSSKDLSDLLQLLKKSETKKCRSCASKEIKLSDEAKQKISNSKKNLSQETRVKLSKIHKDKKLTQKMKDDLRKIKSIKIICLNNGIEYSSIKEAAEKLNCHASSISAILKGEKDNIKGYKFAKIN